MPKAGALVLALVAALLTAHPAAAALQRYAPYGYAPPGAYAPPPPAVILPPGRHLNLCYGYATPQEVEKGIRHWTGRCWWG